MIGNWFLLVESLVILRLLAYQFHLSSELALQSPIFSFCAGEEISGAGYSVDLFFIFTAQKDKSEVETASRAETTAL